MPPLLAIVGATATGKSALGMILAAELGGEIVNADALQVYRGFDIGTAKPSAAERQRIPHHLIDILDPEERYSAGEFARRAEEAIAGIAARGRLPIVVGGSGLYLKALLEGISPVPAGDPAVRAELLARLAAEGLPALYRELQERDAETAARLPAGDTQRILRALEVEQASGRPLSAWISRHPFGKKRISAIAIGLTVPRAILYDQIASRVHRMVEQGWMNEVADLLDGGVSPEVPAFQAIGYRQIVLHLRGEWSRERALEETIRSTRRFAKRQETWFRREPDIQWYSAQPLERQISEILDYAKSSGLGRAHAEAQH